MSGDSPSSRGCAAALIQPGRQWASGCACGAWPQGLGHLGAPGDGGRPSRSQSWVWGTRLVLLEMDPKLWPQTRGSGVEEGPTSRPGGRRARRAPPLTVVSLSRPCDGARSDMSISSVCTCVSWLLPPLAFHSEMTLGTAHFSLPHLLGLSSSAFQLPFSLAVSPRSLLVLWSPRCPHGPSSGSLSLVTCT